MRDVLAQLRSWWTASEPVGVATVIETFRSAPRPPGATMLVGPDGSVFGSVSGGCVEGAVFDIAQSVLVSGKPVLERYGVSDDQALSVGLTCGGSLDVFVEVISPATFPEFADLVADVEADRPVAAVTIVGHPDSEQLGRRATVRPDVPGLSASLSTSEDDAIRQDVLDLLAEGRSGTLSYSPTDGPGGELTLFVHSFATKPRMLIFGAIDFASAMADIGAFLGYRVTVCDARPVFATRDRFPGADEVVVDWPHRYLAKESAHGCLDARTVIVVLTHDLKFDVPLLQVALGISDLAYVGAMGSRRTHDDRVERLRAVGVSEQQFQRMHSPIGLDLGARTPQETAISIAAEIVARGRGGSAQSLKHLTGSIHHDSHDGSPPRRPATTRARHP